MVRFTHRPRSLDILMTFWPQVSSHECKIVLRPGQKMVVTLMDNFHCRSLKDSKKARECELLSFALMKWQDVTWPVYFERVIPQIILEGWFEMVGTYDSACKNRPKPITAVQVFLFVKLFNGEVSFFTLWIWKYQTNPFLEGELTKHTVDGWNPANQLRLVVYPHHSQGFLHLSWWCFQMSSINSTKHMYGDEFDLLSQNSISQGPRKFL